MKTLYGEYLLKKYAKPKKYYFIDKPCIKIRKAFGKYYILHQSGLEIIKYTGNQWGLAYKTCIFSYEAYPDFHSMYKGLKDGRL